MKEKLSYKLEYLNRSAQQTFLPETVRLALCPLGSPLSKSKINSRQIAEFLKREFQDDSFMRFRLDEPIFVDPLFLDSAGSCPELYLFF